MNRTTTTNPIFWFRLIGFSGLMALSTILFHAYGPLVRALTSGKSNAAASLIQLFFGILLGLACIGVIWLVLRVEKPQNWKTFLKIGPPDLKGMLLYFAMTTITYWLNTWFLQARVWDPIQHALERLGLHGEAMSASVAAPNYQLSPGMAAIFFALLLLISWVEVPEELFFRGYVQNQLQERYGIVISILMGALIWDAAHVFAPANFVERFFLGVLISGVVFALRKNVTPLAIMHPLDNRAGLMAYIFLQIFGVQITDAGMYYRVSTIAWWLIAFAIYLGSHIFRRGKTQCLAF